MSSKYVGTVFIADEWERRLRFPYSNRLINELKTTFPHHTWKPETKEWAVTLSGPSSVTKFEKFVSRYGFVTEQPKAPTRTKLESLGTIVTDLPW